MSEKLPEKFVKWHGIDRTKIPWYPIIVEDKCIGCKLCFVTCGRLVFDFDMDKKKAIVVHKYQCMVGCTTCAAICPSEAITFPDKKIVHKIEKEEKILARIQKKAIEKKVTLDLEKARKEVVDILSKIKVIVNYEIAGPIMSSEILKKIHNEIKDCAVDIIDIKVEAASLKGCWDQKAPARAIFKVVSTEMDDISTYEKKIDKILDENMMVLVNKSSS